MQTNFHLICIFFSTFYLISFKSTTFPKSPWINELSIAVLNIFSLSIFIIFLAVFLFLLDSFITKLFSSPLTFYLATISPELGIPSSTTFFAPVIFKSVVNEFKLTSTKSLTFFVSTLTVAKLSLLSFSL